MTTKEFILEPSEIPLDCLVADQEEIRKYNPQRHEMEQLSAVVYDDLQRHICAGYKDVGSDEFWVRGHMPGIPIMPGVIMCEAAAQLCCYHVQKHNLLEAELIGFGGLEDVRFRDLVVPGDRFLIVAQLIKFRPRRMIVSRFQGFVRQTLVVEGTIRGIPLPLKSLAGRQ